MLALGAVDTAADTFPNARDLGELNSTLLSIREHLTDSDKWDLFKFTIRQTSQVKIQLNQMTSDVSLHLFDGSNKTIRSSRRSGASGADFDTAQSAGTYFVGVKNETTSKTPYLMAVEIRPVSPQGHVDLAYDMGAATTARKFHSTVGDTAPQQFAKFSLASPSSIRMRLEVARADPNSKVIWRVVGNGRTIGPFWTQRGSPRTVVERLSPGTYFMVALREGGEAEFDMNVVPSTGLFDPEFSGPVVGRFDDWMVGVDTSGDKKTCYAFTASKSVTPEDPRVERPAIYFSISPNTTSVFHKVDESKYYDKSQTVRAVARRGDKVHTVSIMFPSGE
jgi:hypothetical protein